MKQISGIIFEFKKKIGLELRQDLNTKINHLSIQSCNLSIFSCKASTSLYKDRSAKSLNDDISEITKRAKLREDNKYLSIVLRIKSLCYPYKSDNFKRHYL